MIILAMQWKGNLIHGSQDKRKPWKQKRLSLHLDVFIISGLIAAEFARRNKVISRTIQICGEQKLEDLHRAIFAAFDREEDHMYEFQIGGKRAMDPKARRYGLPPAMGGSSSDRMPSGDVTRTSVGSLGLKFVFTSHKDSSVHVYYRRYSRSPVGSKHLMVAVKILEQDAFVITAFFTDEVKGGEQIWPKKERG